MQKVELSEQETLAPVTQENMLLVISIEGRKV